jgi:hypothetical protein
MKPIAVQRDDKRSLMTMLISFYINFFIYTHSNHTSVPERVNDPSQLTRGIAGIVAGQGLMAD